MSEVTPQQRIAASRRRYDLARPGSRRVGPTTFVRGAAARLSTVVHGGSVCPANRPARSIAAARACGRGSPTGSPACGSSSSSSRTSWTPRWSGSRGGLQRGHRHLQEPDRRPAGGRPGRRDPVPRLQRAPAHPGRLLGPGPTLPAAADDRGRRIWIVLFVLYVIRHTDRTSSGDDDARSSHRAAQPRSQDAAIGAPNRSGQTNFELYSWLFMRLSGLPWWCWCSATCSST